VALLLGCVQQAFFSEVNAATARVLAAEGCDVFAPASQGCCGALSLHMGREDEAIAFAKRLIAALPDDVDAVVVNAAGCGSAMKGYRHLLRDEPGWRDRAEGFAARVRDVSEWLAALPPRAPRHPLPLSVGYHDACHLSHGQGVRAQPRQLLGGVPGVELVPLAEPEVCCGSAGVYNLLEPAPAAALGERKAGHIRAAGVDLVVSGNPGCLLQLSAGTERGGRRQPVRHLVEVLDASIRGIPSSDLLG
jgi:glycolate oxidase iron-sulfur subunit